MACPNPCSLRVDVDNVDEATAAGRLNDLCVGRHQQAFTEYLEALGRRDHALVLRILLSPIPGSVARFTFLILACERGCQDIVSKILGWLNQVPNGGQDPSQYPINTRCLNDETAIFKAARAGNAGCVAELSWNWQDLQLRTEDKNSPDIFSVARSSGNLCCQLLVKVIGVARMVRQMARSSRPGYFADGQGIIFGDIPQEYSKFSEKLCALLPSIREHRAHLQDLGKQVDSIQQTALDRSTRLLCTAIETAMDNGLFDTCRYLLQASLSTSTLERLLSRWSNSNVCLPSEVSAAAREHMQHVSMSKTKQRVYLCAYLILLAKQGKHDMMLSLLSAESGYAVPDAYIQKHKGCAQCFPKLRQLLAKHSGDLLHNLSVAMKQAAACGNWLASCYALWLMKRDNHLHWHKLDISDQQALLLLEVMTRHRSVMFSAREVMLSNNSSLSILPRAVLFLRQLHTLDISLTQIGSNLPPEVFSLPQLSALHANKCDLVAFPDIQFVHPSLTALIANDNKLADVPAAFATSRLRRLSLARNQLSTITPNILRITSLTFLSVGGNYIEDLPTGLLHLTKLKTLDLENLSLPSALKACKYDIEAIRQYISNRARNLQSCDVRKFIVLGADDQACVHIVDELSSMTSLRNVPFLCFGTVHEYRLLSQVYNTGCSHYLVHIDAGQTLECAETRSCLHAEIAQYSCAVSDYGAPPGLRVRRLFVVVTVEDVPTKAAVKALRRLPRHLQHAAVYVLTFGQRHERDLRELATALAKAPLTRLRVARAIPAITKRLQRLQLPLFIGADKFKEDVMSAGPEAAKFIDDHPDWLQKLCQHMLLSGTGVLLQGVHPIFSTAICSDLMILVQALRRLMCTSQPGMHNSPAIHNLSLITKSAVAAAEVDFHEELAGCLWSIAEQNNLAFQVGLSNNLPSPFAFLPLMCREYPLPDNRQLAISPHNIHRICVLSSISDDAWTRYLAHVLHLQPLFIEEAEPLSNGSDCLVQVWRTGLALVCGNIMLAMVQRIESPCQRFSLGHRHSRLPAVLITVAQQLSKPCLSQLVNGLLQICREFVPDPNDQLKIEDFVPCSMCMRDPAVESAHCQPAVPLLDLVLHNERPLLQCQFHPDEVAQQEHLSDLLLHHLHDHCPPCCKDDLRSLDTPSCNEDTEVRWRNAISFNQFLGEDPVVVKRYAGLDLEAHPASAVRELGRELTVASCIQGRPYFLDKFHPMMSSHRNVSLVMTRRGSALSNSLADPNQLSAIQWQHIAVQIAHGLAFLHSHGFIHGDMKMDNILLCKHGGQHLGDLRTYVIDYNTTIRHLVAGLRQRVGTPAYAAPETDFCSCGFEYSFPADIYSFGVMLLETVAGKKISETVTKNRHLERHLDLLLREALKNTLGVASLLSAALKCITISSVDRPDAAELVRVLSKLSNYMLRQSWPIDEGVTPSSLAASHCSVGAGRSSLLGIVHDQQLFTDVEPCEGHPTDHHSLRCLPVPPKEHLGQILTEGHQRISCFAVTSTGLICVGRSTAIEIFSRLDEVERVLVKTIRVSHAPFCMISWRSYVFVGLSNGDIVVIQSTGQQAEDNARLFSVTSKDGFLVKQILPVETNGNIFLWCLTVGPQRRVQQVVVRLLFPHRGFVIESDVDQVEPKPSEEARAECQLCQLVQSSMKRLVWGAAESRVYAWNTETFRTEGKPYDITSDLEYTEHWDRRSSACRWSSNEAISDDTKKRPLSDILCLCAVNGVLWIGTRLGSIILYSERCELEHLATLDAHCSSVRCLLVLPSCGDDGASSERNKEVVSVGCHLALECSLHPASLKSVAKQRQLHQQRECDVCTAGCETALLWEACNPDTISEIQAHIPT